MRLVFGVPVVHDIELGASCRTKTEMGDQRSKSVAETIVISHDVYLVSCVVDASGGGHVGCSALPGFGKMLRDLTAVVVAKASAAGNGQALAMR